MLPFGSQLDDETFIVLLDIKLDDLGCFQTSKAYQDLALKVFVQVPLIWQGQESHYYYSK